MRKESKLAEVLLVLLVLLENAGNRSSEYLIRNYLDWTISFQLFPHR